MTQKELNRVVARKIAENAFWKADLFTRYYAADFTMDIPTAPPGMPNHYTTWEAERCFEWFNRSVKSWNVELEEFYGSPGPERFWAFGHCGGDVHWGDHDGHFWTKFILQIEFDHGKVNYLSWRMDPVAMLEAAGRDRPEFNMALDDPRVRKFQPWHSIFSYEEVTQRPASGDSKEAILQRRSDNLEQFRCGVEREKYRTLETRGEEELGGAWFVPKEQSDAEKAHAYESVGGLNPVFAWVKTHSPWMYRDPRGRIYETDDPNVFFGEMDSHGPGSFGNSSGGERGHYHQNYLMYIRMDDNGRLVVWEEFLSTVNIYNSAAIKMQSFPYYY